MALKLWQQIMLGWLVYGALLTAAMMLAEKRPSNWHCVAMTDTYIGRVHLWHHCDRWRVFPRTDWEPVEVTWHPGYEGFTAYAYPVLGYPVYTTPLGKL